MNADYWRLEKQKLIAELEQRIVSNKQFIAFKELEHLNLPNILRVSLRKEARNVFLKERPIRIIQSNRFDFSEPAFKNHIRILRDHLIERVRFRPEEVRKTIRFTVTLCFDLITRPVSTVKSMLFRTQPERLSEEVVDVLRGLSGDVPFVRALLAELEKDPKNYFSKEDYNAVSEKLKADLYAGNPVASLCSDLEMLWGFYFEVFQTDVHEFSADLMYGMLVERGLHDYAASFLEERSQKETWSFEAFQQFLERHLIVGRLAEGGDDIGEPVQYIDEPAAAALTSERENSDVLTGNDSDRQTVSRALTVTQPARHSEMNPENETGYMRFFFGKRDNSNASNGAGNEKKPKSSKENDRTPSMGDSSSQDNDNAAFDATDNFGRSFRSNFEFDDTATASINRSQLEYQPPGPYPSLHVIIDKKSETLFVKKIFGKDQRAYKKFIKRIESEDSWKTAKTILNEELSAREIRPYCREAVKLSDLLFSRYFSKGQY